MIKLTDLLNENLRSGDVSKLQKGLERILGTNVNYDINSNDAYEFYIDNAEFYIGVGDGEELGAKFAFDIYNDGATKTLASGTSDNLNDIIKQVLTAARKYKKSLLQTESVNEEFTAVSNKSGKTVVFKDKAARDAAVKAGTHSDDEESGKEEPKGEKKPNMFSKDAGYDAPDTDKSDEPNQDNPFGVDRLVYNKRTKTVGIVRMADERGETKTDADGNVNTSELEPYNPFKYPHQKDAKVAPSTQKEIDSRGLFQPFAQNGPIIQEPKSEPSKYDSEYFADDEKSDSSPMGGYDDDDDYYYDDEDDGKAGYKKTVERLDKVENALIDDLKLRDNGFSTARSSGGGGGYWEGPLTISSDDVPYDDERFVELSIGSGMNDGNFSIGFTDADGMEVFDGGYSITGNRELSPEETFKLAKALMKNPDVQKFLKGQISKEEFKTVYDKLASKFSKSTNEGPIKLMNLLRK